MFEAYLNRKINDMLVGEVGYTVPWALSVKRRKRWPWSKEEEAVVVGINGHYGLYPTNGGTATLRVIRVDGGVMVGSVAGPVGLTSVEWPEEDCLPVLNAPDALKPAPAQFGNEAEALAQAVLTGDMVAARALTDYMVEYFSREAQ